jgi:hypothetical protein
MKFIINYFRNRSKRRLRELVMMRLGASGLWIEDIDNIVEYIDKGIVPNIRIPPPQENSGNEIRD